MKRFVISITLLFVSFSFLGGQNVKRVDAFVYCDTAVTTPLNALRAELTHELVNNADSTYVVNDRSDEILSYLRRELNYQESGMVREDQLVRIGEHFGANYLCVVNVTKYQEYNQYFFEGVLVDITTRTIVKHSYYPQEGASVGQLDPQTQLKVGKELAGLLGIRINHRKDTLRTAAATTTVRVYTGRRVLCHPESESGMKIGDYYTGEHTFRGRKYESTQGRNFIIGYLDYTGKHGLAYYPYYPTYWSVAKEDTYIGAYVANTDQLLKIYSNNDQLKLSGLYWTLEVAKTGKPGQANDTYKAVNFSNGKILEKEEGRRSESRGLLIIVF